MGISDHSSRVTGNSGPAISFIREPISARRGGGWDIGPATTLTKGWRRRLIGTWRILPPAAAACRAAAGPAFRRGKSNHYVERHYSGRRRRLAVIPADAGGQQTTAAGL